MRECYVKIHVSVLFLSTSRPFLEGSKVRGPLVAHPLGVVDLLLPLNDVPDGGLHVGVRHHHVGPGLGVGAAGRGPCRAQQVVNDRAWHGALAVEAHCAPLVHILPHTVKVIK